MEAVDETLITIKENWISIPLIISLCVQVTHLLQNMSVRVFIYVM